MSRNNFIDLLVDIHIFDAFSTDHSLSGYFKGIDSLSLYTSIFRKHHANYESFEKTMNWYSEQPEKLNKLYDEVFGKINKMNQELSEQLALFTKPGTRTIYNYHDYSLIRGDTVNYPKPIIVEINTKGTYLISAQIRMLEDDESINPLMTCYFYKNEEDNRPEERKIITEFPIQKTNFSRTYQFISELDNKNYNYLKIIIPETSNKDNVFNKNFQLSSLKVMLISDETGAEVETE